MNYTPMRKPWKSNPILAFFSLSIKSLRKISSQFTRNVQNSWCSHLLLFESDNDDGRHGVCRSWRAIGHCNRPWDWECILSTMSFIFASPPSKSVHQAALLIHGPIQTEAISWQRSSSSKPSQAMQRIVTYCRSWGIKNTKERSNRLHWS